MTKTKENKEKAEYDRLVKLYSDLPPKTLELYKGMLTEAARLKVLCDDLWADIQANGKFEEWIKAGEAYERERDASKAYRDANRLYQAIIKDLESKLPTKSENKGLFAKLGDD